MILLFFNHVKCIDTSSSENSQLDQIHRIDKKILNPNNYPQLDYPCLIRCFWEGQNHLKVCVLRVHFL